jgi:hypothetical protein
MFFDKSSLMLPGVRQTDKSSTIFIAQFTRLKEGEWAEKEEVTLLTWHIGI